MKSLHKAVVWTIIVTLLFTPLIVKTTLSAPPPEPKTFDIIMESEYSVYVSQASPSKNYNSGTNQYYLNIQQDEFTHKYVSFVKFDLTELPDDAEILDAEISLYLIDDPDQQATVKMYPVRQNWYESSVTWNSRPSYKDFTKTGGLIDSIIISSAGWKEWDATSVVEDWVEESRANYGIAFETNVSIPLFRSDESSYEPELYILYQTTSGDEPDDPPEDPPEDTTPCEITYAITPESPQSGDEVTLSATATDNIGLEYLTIKEGSIERCTSFAEDDETTELTCEYTETLFTPGKTYFIEANDKGTSPPELVTFTIDVAGTGSNPEVSLDIVFDEQDAIPENYRLLPMDGQRVDITVTATDPDGIDFLTLTCDGIPYDYSYDPPQTDVEETITLINGVDILDDCTPPCTFRYFARVYDTEGRSSRVDGDDIDIDAPWQWYWGLPFANWGCDENHTWGWDMMESIYGDDEVWLDMGYGWKRPRAERLYENKVEEGGRNGQCWGMCLLALELAKPGSGLYANYIQDNASGIDDLERVNWNYTWRYYYARQAGQYSKDKQDVQSDQFWDQNGLSTVTSSGLHPHLENILNDIIDDLEDGNPGVLGIRGAGGHAVVPWRVLPGEGATPTRIYIYDPNRPHASTHDSTDYTNTNHYPFIEVGVDSSLDGWWSYIWNSTSTWDGNIYYYSYNTAIGDVSEKNYIGYAEITDQKLPSSSQITAMGSGDATFYATDASGRSTGYVDGEIIAEIPYSYPIIEYAGSSNEQVMFVYPNNITLNFSIESQINSDDEMGSYSFVLMDNATMYDLDNASCTRSTIDTVLFSPRSSNAKTQDYSYRFRRGDVTKIRFLDPQAYTISIVKEFYNSPKPVVREYQIISNQYENGAEFELYVSDDYDDLIVETYNSSFNFTLETKSTESLEKDSNLSYIPSSKETFSMKANDKMVLTPMDWATTSATGSFTIDDTRQSDDTPQTPGFELILMLTSLIGFILWKKR